MKRLFTKKTKQPKYMVCWVDTIITNAYGNIAIFKNRELAEEYAEYKQNTCEDPSIEYYVQEIRE